MNNQYRPISKTVRGNMGTKIRKPPAQARCDGFDFPTKQQLNHRILIGMGLYLPYVQNIARDYNHPSAHHFFRLLFIKKRMQLPQLEERTDNRTATPRRFLSRLMLFHFIGYQ